MEYCNSWWFATVDFRLILRLLQQFLQGISVAILYGIIKYAFVRISDKLSSKYISFVGFLFCRSLAGRPVALVILISLYMMVVVAAIIGHIVVGFVGVGRLICKYLIGRRGCALLVTRRYQLLLFHFIYSEIK